MKNSYIQVVLHTGRDIFLLLSIPTVALVQLSWRPLACRVLVSLVDTQLVSSPPSRGPWNIGARRGIEKREEEEEEEEEGRGRRDVDGCGSRAHRSRRRCRRRRQDE